MANDNKQPKTDPEAGRRKKEEQARRARRRSRQLIGLALTILIVVGAVSIVQMGIGLVQDLTDDTELRQEYEHRVEPLVWVDILPFEDLVQADQRALKQALLWQIYYDQQDTLAIDPEREEPLIPLVELNIYAANLFGPGFEFTEHATFTEPTQNMTYRYDAVNETYAIPVTSPLIYFLPKVEAIQREGGGVRRVVVGYVANELNENSLNIIQTPDYEHPVRYMDFLFRRDGNEYYLYAVERNTTMEVTAPTSSSASTPVVLPDEDDSSASGSDSLFLPNDGSSTPGSTGSEAGSSLPEDGSGAEGGDGDEEDASSSEDAA